MKFTADAPDFLKIGIKAGAAHTQAKRRKPFPKTRTIAPSKPGQKPVTFKPGALHAQLGVAQGQKIPSDKMDAAKSGSLGALAQKRANFATGFLAAGKK
jgi:hypothetical protein